MTKTASQDLNDNYRGFLFAWFVFFFFLNLIDLFTGAYFLKIFVTK